MLFRSELELSAEEEDSCAVVEEVTEATRGRFQGLDAADFHRRKSFVFLVLQGI